MQSVLTRIRTRVAVSNSCDDNYYTTGTSYSIALLSSLWVPWLNEAVWDCFAFSTVVVSQSAGAIEYTDCFSAEGKDPRKECPGYDTKKSDGEVPVMLQLWGMQSTP